MAKSKAIKKAAPPQPPPPWPERGAPLLEDVYVKRSNLEGYSSTLKAARAGRWSPGEPLLQRENPNAATAIRINKRERAAAARASAATAPAVPDRPKRVCKQSARAREAGEAAAAGNAGKSPASKKRKTRAR